MLLRSSRTPKWNYFERRRAVFPFDNFPSRAYDQVSLAFVLCMISAKSFVSKTTNKDNIRKCYYSINCCLHVLLGQHGKWRNSCWSLLFWPSSHTWRVSWPIQTTTWWSGGQILDASDATWKKAVRYVHNCLVPPMCPCSKWKQCGEMLYCSYVK